MRKPLLLLSVIFCAHILFAQETPVKLYIVVDEVQLYAAPSAAATVSHRLPADAEVFGTALGANWYEVTLDLGEKAYIMAWDVWPEQDLELIPKRITPSASTLFRMMRYFRHNDKPEKAQEFALRIINAHNDEEYPGEGKSCFKLGHKAYIEMISDNDGGVNYDSWLLGFTSKVIEEAENATVRAMAHYHQARFYALNGQIDRSLEQLFVIFEKYPSLASSNECEPEKLESWYYRPERAKRLFCALTIIQTADVLEKVEKDLQQILATGTEESRALAQELLENIGSMPYPKDESIWN